MSRTSLLVWCIAWLAPAAFTHSFAFSGGGSFGPFRVNAVGGQAISGQATSSSRQAAILKQCESNGGPDETGSESNTKTREHPAPSRRDYLRSMPQACLAATAMTAWCVSPRAVKGAADSGSLPLHVVEASTIIPAECQNGGLVAESAVPGAYDQVCMNLPLRTIPLRLPNDTRINLQIQQEGVGPGKTGLAVWNSALLLGRLLQALTVANPSLLRNKQLVEIGCGAGLVSLMAARLGAQAVWATDGNPAAVALAQSNFERNNIPYTTTISPITREGDDAKSDSNIVTVMQWGELQVPLEWMGKADIIVGSDLTYNSGSWRVLAETMESLLGQNGFFLYLSLGHAGFNVRGELDGFLNVAKEAGLSVRSSSHLPFSLPAGVSSLDALLQSVVLPSEQTTLAATGGAQVVVLGKK